MPTVTVQPVSPGSRRKTPPRSTQLDDAPWFRFGAVAHRIGISRASLMTTLMLWFIRWPGVKLPQRLAEDEIPAAEAAFKAAEDERKRRLAASTADQEQSR